MSRHMITIRGQSDREQAARWSMHAKEGMRVEFKQPKRTDDQNAKLWAMLGEVAAQVPWHGIKLAADDWKFIFMDALKRELRVVPNIDGTGFVNLGRSSSDLSKAEMSDLIELIHEFGARQNIVFKEDSNSSDAARQMNEPATAESVPPLAVAGDNSESSVTSPADDDAQAGGGSPAAGLPSTLPQGWGLEYAAALRRAQKPDSLAKYGKQFWETRAWPDAGPDRETALAIFAAFKDHFNDKAAIEDALRELV